MFGWTIDVYVKFNRERLNPCIYTSNSDAATQTVSKSQDAGVRFAHAIAGNTPQQDEGFAHGNGLPDDFKLWLRHHPGIPIDEARTRYREEQKAKRRRQGPKL